MQSRPWPLLPVWAALIPAVTLLAAPKSLAQNCPAPAVPLTPIFQIQGKEGASSLAGQAVVVEGIVTGDFQPGNQLGGFYLQERVGDGDPETSDGIFIFVPPANPLSKKEVAAGDRVRVSGAVKEFGPQGRTLTELDRVSEVLVCEGGQGVEPTALALPVGTPGQLERYEGMLVRLAQTLTITDTNELGERGELVLSADGRLFVPTNGQGGSSELNARRRLVLDDASNLLNPKQIPYFTGTDKSGTRRLGDTVAGLTGILTSGFGTYRLQPTAPPEFVQANPRTAAPAPVGGRLKVASFNVLNYFTTLGSRGAANDKEFERQQGKVVAALKAIDADVVGLIEIQNNGLIALDNLTAALNKAYGRTVFDVVIPPLRGTGTDDIQVGIIYKPERVKPVGPSRSDPEPIFDRPPLAQTFQARRSGPRSTFTVVVNHFKSKGSCPDPGPDADADKGQGCWNLRRVAQARKLLAFVKTLNDPDVLVVGDLNAYGGEDPIKALGAGGLVSLNLRIPAAERYSYVFEGQSGYLDHALATPSLDKQVTGITEWHVNSDEPPVIDYNTEYSRRNPAAKKDDRYEPTPYRSSDHDPVVVGLELKADGRR
ncbi:ExeM/NucH family extracellular endonuclease [Gloeobacter violaceus]|nr:ExeM/NucH family extracellular endonuclease [Gloeobacter violaceus]